VLSLLCSPYLLLAEGCDWVTLEAWSYTHV
jgi:hypothetical protein